MAKTKRPHILHTSLSEDTDKRLRWLCYKHRMTPAQVLELVIADASKRSGYQAAQAAPTPHPTPEPQ